MQIQRFLIHGLTLCCCGLTVLAGVEPAATSGLERRVAVSAVGVVPEPVAAWDPASVQRLVRLDGKLYQQDAGFFYRVRDDEVSVRLGSGVRDWEDFLTQVEAISPVLGQSLSSLVPLGVNRLGIVDLRLPDRDPTTWAARLHSTGLVRYAEVTTEGVWLDIPPDDALYPQQWALSNTGQTGGTPGADVDAQAAWAISAGTPAVIVAVLDSGTAVGHQDLALNVWINEDEVPSNGVDDDDNGYVDDWRGWDFGNGNNDPNSSFYHGTHVTGIVNAAGDNGIGVAGLAGGLAAPGVRGMALAVGEFGPSSGVIDDAILYAADNGARVITLSLSAAQSQAIDDALDYAHLTRDVFIDCASGNNGPSVSYPANQATVMAVASTDHNDVKSSFSNPGPQVAVAAPGSNILSTQLNNSYDDSSGTSFAAPYVAALAALIRGVNPTLTAAEVRQLIIDTADDVGPPGFDNGTGFGRINAFRALFESGAAAGSIELSSATYGCTERARITVTDTDLAGDGSLAIGVTSEVEPAGETVALFEIDFGVFVAEIALAAGAATADGQLQVGHGDSLIAEYVDADDGAGGLDVVNTAAATIDCAGPGIAGVEVEAIDDHSATVRWTTDEPATSLVTFGNSVPPTEVTSDAESVSEHALALDGLVECTTYSFSVSSTDAFGNATTEDHGGAFHAFQTLGDFAGDGLGSCEAGHLQFDETAYGCSGPVSVTLTDSHLNASLGARERVWIRLTSTSEPSGEWLELVETGQNTAAFTGAMALTSAPAAGDGLLGAAAGDLLSATYHDADDGEGISRVVVAVAHADCSAPRIEHLRVVEVSATRAVIEWTTDEPATSRIDYGASAALGLVVEDATLKTDHRLALSAFDACERIWFRASSRDAHGELAVSGVGGQPFDFYTNRIGGLVYHETFEEDTAQWDLEGDWQIASPAGLGQSSSDPATAWSGSKVLGTDLTGLGNTPGSYELGSDAWAYTEDFSASGRENLELIVRRKLGLSAPDIARIRVRHPLSINIAWSASGPIDDEGWTEQRLDISALADGKPSIAIGFGLKSFLTGTDYGWNIDEVIVKDAGQPDYESCGGCAGAPAFGGLVSVADPAPCAASGLVLEWAAPVAWGTGSTGTFEIHRGSSADFLPGAGNLVASGVTATTWTDVTAPVGTPVWYVVRARNDESCGVEGGLADGNLVRVGAVETIAQDSPANVEDSLSAMLVGEAHVRLDWDAVAGATHYVVRRATSSDFSDAVPIATTSASQFEDVLAGPNGSAFYAYRVFAVNACGEEETAPPQEEERRARLLFRESGPAAPN